MKSKGDVFLSSRAVELDLSAVSGSLFWARLWEPEDTTGSCWRHLRISRWRG